MIFTQKHFNFGIIFSVPTNVKTSLKSVICFFIIYLIILSNILFRQISPLSSNSDFNVFSLFFCLGCSNKNRQRCTKDHLNYIGLLFYHSITLSLDLRLLGSLWYLIFCDQSADLSSASWWTDWQNKIHFLRNNHKNIADILPETMNIDYLVCFN